MKYRCGFGNLALSVLACTGLMAGHAAAAPDVPGKGKYISVITPVTSYPAMQPGPELLDPNNKIPVGVLSEPVTVAYLKKIANNLLAGWQGPRPPLYIYIQPSDQFTSDATIGGTLVFTTGVLNYFATSPAFQSEDCMAFVVAHELAHVLLNHPADMRNSKKMMDKTNGALQLMSTLAHMAKYAPVGGGAALAYVADSALVEMAQEYIFPIWQRGQEVEADTLAIDLMARANYSVEEALKVLEIFKQREQEEHEKQAALDRDFFKDVVNTGNPVTGFFNQGLGWLGRNAQATLHDIAADHPGGAKRLKKARAYINREYDDQMVTLRSAPFRAFIGQQPVRQLLTDVKSLNTIQTASLDKHNAPTADATLRVLHNVKSAAVQRSEYYFYLEYAARQQKGQGNQMLGQLHQAYLRPDVTEDIAKAYAQTLETQKQYTQALGIYENIQKQFGDDGMYAYRIRVIKKQNPKGDTAILMAKCIATGDDAIKTLCNDAQNNKL
ncbi:M48 family metallopeptidase [Komagataeibacter sp. FNDCR2]|uniref:M48 family metallopeptidase n=1 Tax=Komagataeibacter sp. FNDCR2 TaxID=2878682 RepID=UPI001E65D134|nr:M48 family metallopeptidase [Komagataeibacter sp. FNDCR2]MCE2574245.1 M48 family metallopeptidase [Komagataeibacter sp. FNDCR2]